MVIGVVSFVPRRISIVKNCALSQKTLTLLTEFNTCRKIKIHHSGKKHLLYYASEGSELSIGLAIDSTTDFPDTTSENTGTGIRVNAELPSKFVRDQNYPNPFNPATVISYQIPVNSYVTLRVFDILGREVATLVSERKNAGTYSVQWNASGFSSGVYFCRLEADGKREIRKMILMK